jgi:hypothetical protein
MRIEAQPALEAYIGESGDICLRQDSSDEDNKIISIPPEYVGKLIKWLQILQKESHGSTEDFAVVD